MTPVRSPRPSRPLLAALVLALAAAPVLALSPRDDLLRRVPDDVAFCLAVQDLRGHAQAFRGSPFWKSLASSSWTAAVRASPEFKKLADADAFLAKTLGLGLEGIGDDLVGDAVVLAFRPKPPGASGQDQGLFLTRARDARVLADFLDRLHAAQKQSGELRVLEERRHAGAVYHRRVDKDGESFYALDGPVLLFSTWEPMLRQALDRGAAPSDASAAPLLARRLDEVGAGRALAGLWINPRAFDAEMRKNAAAAQGDAAAVQRGILRLWEALDGLGLALEHDRDIRLTLGLRADPARLPPALHRLADALVQPSAAWDRLPEGALLTVAARLDPAALLDLLGAFLTDSSRQALHDALQHHLGDPFGKDFARDLLPALGPDVALSLVAPPPGQASPLPGLVLAVKARSGPGDPDRALLDAVRFYAQMGVVAHNRAGGPRLTLTSARDAGPEVHVLAGDGVFPPGVQPAFALSGGWLRLATTPRLAASAPSSSSHIAVPHGEVALAHLAAAEVRRWLHERRAALAQLWADRDSLPREEAARRLDALGDLCGRLDRADLTARLTSGRLLLTLRVAPTLPLK